MSLLNKSPVADTIMIKPSQNTGFILNTRVMLYAAFLITGVFTLGGCNYAEYIPGSNNTNSTNTNSLSSYIQSSLGVTQQQAQGGAGILLQQAQSQLMPEQFKQLSQYIPDISQLLGAAPATSKNNMLSGFQSLGLGADMPLKFGTATQQYLQQTGGSSATSLLMQALPSIL